MSKFASNDEKFNQLRRLKLPIGHYAISYSGPLGIREIRQISDIDLIVDDELWCQLLTSHKIEFENGMSKIYLSEDIEAFSDDSFLSINSDCPTARTQINGADMIDGLPFVSLEHTRIFKNILGRDKDKRDIESIDRLLAK